MWIRVARFPPLIRLRMERRMQSIDLIIDEIEDYQSTQTQPEQSGRRAMDDTKT